MTEAPPSPRQSDEQVLAVVGSLTRTSGFMGAKQKAYSLTITDRRIIFAELSKEKIKALTKQAAGEAKDAGRGLLGRLGAQMNASANYHNVYRQMTPEEILAETPGNFAIERGDIQKLTFKTGMVDESHNQSDHITIKATSGKYKFNVGGSLSAAKEAFRAAGIS
jgi:hypothetical protein